MGSLPLPSDQKCKARASHVGLPCLLGREMEGLAQRHCVFWAVWPRRHRSGTSQEGRSQERLRLQLWPLCLGECQGAGLTPGGGVLGPPWPTWHLLGTPPRAVSPFTLRVRSAAQPGLPAPEGNSLPVLGVFNFQLQMEEGTLGHTWPLDLPRGPGAPPVRLSWEASGLWLTLARASSCTHRPKGILSGGAETWTTCSGDSRLGPLECWGAASDGTD